MPFRSKQQAKWMFATHPEMAERWADETPSLKKLPSRAGCKKKRRTFRIKRKKRTDS